MSRALEYIELLINEIENYHHTIRELAKLLSEKQQRINELEERQELPDLLDKLEGMEFWSIKFSKHAIYNPETRRHESTGRYRVNWCHNRISWVDLPEIIGESREDALHILIAKAEKLLATDHQFGDGLNRRKR